MLVKLLIGGRAGETVDMPVPLAKDLIRNERAESVREAAPVPEEQAVAAAALSAPEPAKKRRRGFVKG